MTPEKTGKAPSLDKIHLVIMKKRMYNKQVDWN